MDQPYFFQTFFSCCSQSCVQSKAQAKKIIQKVSLRSKSKKKRKDYPHKVSLKTFQDKRSVKIKSQIRNKQDYLFRYPSVQQSELKSFRPATVKQTKSNIYSSFKKETRPYSYRQKTDETQINPLSPKSIQSKQFKFGFEKKNQIYHAPEIRTYDSQRQLFALKKKKFNQNKGFYGENTRQKTVQQQIKEDIQSEVNEQIQKKFKKKSVISQRLGQSNKTLLSLEQKQAKSFIKIEQSVIMINHFNPNQSQIQKWGLTYT